MTLLLLFVFGGVGLLGTVLEFNSLFLLQLALQDHTLGEVPLSHHTNFVSVTASHYPTHSPTGVNISKTTFHLPHNMATILNRSANSPRVSTNGSGEGGHLSHCFQARAISFQQNPFIYRKQAPRENIEVSTGGGFVIFPFLWNPFSFQHEVLSCVKNRQGIAFLLVIGCTCCIELHPDETLAIDWMLKTWNQSV